ncbi:MAG: polyprenyl synthetase family protein [Thermoanaerobaculales bacterium]|nr:polyprenyl synthetase family protein [Thermoanaerobaculales bacterium]
MKGAVSTLRDAIRIREVFEPISPRLELVEQFFLRELEGALPMVREVGSYVLGGGGKRLRPALVLLVSRMLGYSGDRDVRYGAVVEFIHTATLIHDDIIDGSDLRRGQPTANRRWSNEITVLVGDWLYSRSMDLCLEYGDVEVMKRLNAATLRMTEGEILSAHVRGRVDVDEKLFMDITRCKTAELFAAACSIPALFEPSTHRYEDHLRQFGLDLGLCFQLVDDVLDFTSDQEEVGKPVMADLCEGRATLPILLLLERIDAGTRKKIEAVARDRCFEAISEQELLDLVQQSGVLDEVRLRAAALAEKAAEVARFLPECREREALIGATQLLLKRRK